jgi:CheY-like chemotaxis protein
MSELGVCVLVVDDDAFTAELTGMVLEEAGFEVVIAIGGADALKQMGVNASIRVVVSDMNMPNMNGIEFFHSLREQGFQQPFILMTGEAVAALRQAHPQLDGVLAKDEEYQEILPGLVATLAAAC